MRLTCVSLKLLSARKIFSMHANSYVTYRIPSRVLRRGTLRSGSVAIQHFHSISLQLSLSLLYIVSVQFASCLQHFILSKTNILIIRYGIEAIDVIWKWGLPVIECREVRRFGDFGSFWAQRREHVIHQVHQLLV